MCVLKVLGGLLSAHLYSKEAGLDLDDSWPCDGPLLRLAVKIADKLVPGIFQFNILSKFIRLYLKTSTFN